ncbi:hypothetical protein F5878DRAFT_349886 [Lentinula raphanica]|uniref:Uncharacterized protein n=1 Tax=Lentinula raphanica TaxID=153919 RepID=A0AA38P1J9_9AGAR|nr:hypothetical protein F5878DRAFT_349886 [Lentinula raphanica]
MSNAPQESMILVGIGQVIYWNVASLIVTCIAYGFNLLAASIAVSLFLKNGTRGLARKILLSLTLIIMRSTTWDVINRAGLYLTQIDYILMRPLSGGVLAQAVAANKATLPYEYVDGWPVTINLLVGDGIVSWRAWAIYPHKIIVRASLVLLMLGNIAVNVADVIMEDVNPSGQTHSLALDTASIWVSLGVNAFATSIVALKMLRHRRSISIISRKGRRTVVDVRVCFVHSNHTERDMPSLDISLSVHPSRAHTRFTSVPCITNTVQYHALHRRGCGSGYLSCSTYN